jgi:alpha-D-xyloside xylohydrolase
MPRGQYGATLSDSDKTNDRSPWNMAAVTGDPDLLDMGVREARWRMNLLPHAYNEAIHSVESGLPLMRHLLLDYPDDKECLGIEDQFLFGSLLVAPVLEENVRGRSVYLPQGSWLDLWSGEEREGGHRFVSHCGPDRIPVYLRDGTALPLNLDATFRFGSDVGNRMDAYDRLTFLLAGVRGSHTFRDDLGNAFCLSWAEGRISVSATAGGRIPKSLYFLSVRPLAADRVTRLPDPPIEPYKACRLDVG